MKTRWLRGLLLGGCLALLLGGGAWAQDVQPAFEPPPDPPTATEGLYVTTEDNDDNAGTGVADGDMGYTDTPWVCDDDEEAPIEFNIVVAASTCSGGELSIASRAFEDDNDEVYINGHFLGYLTEEEGYSVFLFDVPQAALNEGTNRVRIVIDDCGEVAWGALAIEPCEAEGFVPEPGSVLLLGSGLAGVAGYAALRLRSGHALRARTIE
jgi:hypothetical protein